MILTSDGSDDVSKAVYIMLDGICEIIFFIMSSTEIITTCSVAECDYNLPANMHTGRDADLDEMHRLSPLKITWESTKRVKR